MATFTSAAHSKLHQGTYKVVARVDWTVLMARDFGHPDWNTMYPLNNKGQPVGLLTPRLACKVFHDGLYIIKQGEEKPKVIQDLIPEIAHKCFKKKQWRKQFYEAMRRVVCRLAAGKGIRPNCIAEDVFFHAIMAMSFELGWRRIDEFIQTLPECDKDKDMARLTRMGGNEEIGALLKGTQAAGKEKKAGGLGDSKLDVKSWFKCYDLTEEHLFDHIVKIEEEDTDNWSVNTSNTASTASSHQRSRGDSNLSVGDVGAVPSPSSAASNSPIRTGIRKPRSNSSTSQNSIDKMYGNIGLPMRKGKQRSDSAVSALTEDAGEHHAEAGADTAAADLSSLSFNAGEHHATA